MGWPSKLGLLVQPLVALWRWLRRPPSVEPGKPPKRLKKNAHKSKAPEREPER